MAKNDESTTKLNPITEYKDDMSEFVALANGCMSALEWISAKCDILYYETHDKECNTLSIQVDETLTKWKKLREFLTKCEQRSI